MVVLTNGAFTLDGVIKTSGIVVIYPSEVETLVNEVGRDQKISCIKEARIRWGLGLKDAKELIETVIRVRKTFTQVIERTVYAYDETEALNFLLPLNFQMDFDATIVSVREGY